MNDNLRETLGWAIRSIIPFLTGIGAVFVTLVPVALPYSMAVTPVLPLGVVFFWTVNWPTLMPPIAVFTIGIIYDLLTGGPIGLWAVVFLVAQAFTVSERGFLYGKTFAINWIGFVPVIVTATAVGWFIASLGAFTPLPATPVVVQAAILLGLYPFFGWVLARVQNLMVRLTE